MTSVRAEIEAAQARVKALQSEAEAKKVVDTRTKDEKLADSLGIDRKALPKLLETFAAFDKDGDGTIDVDELGTVLASLGRQTSEAKVREMIDTFNKGAADSSSILFPVFLDIVASGAIDISALLGKSDTNPDGSMEHSMQHKTLQAKEIMKVRDGAQARGRRCCCSRIAFHGGRECSADFLRDFVSLNIGRWSRSFYRYDRRWSGTMSRL